MGRLTWPDGLLCVSCPEELMLDDAKHPSAEGKLQCQVCHPLLEAIGTCSPAALTGIPAADLRLTPASQHGRDDIPYPGVITGSSTALRCNRTGAQSPDMQAFGRWALTRAPPPATAGSQMDQSHGGDRPELSPPRLPGPLGPGGSQASWEAGGDWGASVMDDDDCRAKSGVHPSMGI